MQWFKRNSSIIIDDILELINRTLAIFDDMEISLSGSPAERSGGLPIPPFKKKNPDEKDEDKPKVKSRTFDKNELRPGEYEEKINYKDPGNAISDYKQDFDPTNPISETAGAQVGLTFDEHWTSASLIKTAELDDNIEARIDELWGLLSEKYADLYSTLIKEKQHVSDALELAQDENDKLQYLLEQSFNLPGQELLIQKQQIRKNIATMKAQLLEHQITIDQISGLLKNIAYRMKVLRDAKLVSNEAFAKMVNETEQEQVETTGTKPVTTDIEKNTFLDKQNAAVQDLLIKVQDTLIHLNELNYSFKSRTPATSLVDIYSSRKSGWTRDSQDDDDPEAAQEQALGDDTEEAVVEEEDQEDKKPVEEPKKQPAETVPEDEEEVVTDTQKTSGPGIFDMYGVSQLAYGATAEDIEEKTKELQEKIEKELKEYSSFLSYDFQKGAFVFKDTSEEKLKDDYTELDKSADSYVAEKNRLSTAVELLGELRSANSVAINDIDSEIKKLNVQLKQSPQQHSVIKKSIGKLEEQKVKITDTIEKIETAIDDMSIGIPALEVSYDSTKAKLKDHDYTKLVHAKSLVSDYYAGVTELEKYADSSKP